VFEIIGLSCEEEEEEEDQEGESFDKSQPSSVHRTPSMCEEARLRCRRSLHISFNDLTRSAVSILYLPIQDPLYAETSTSGFRIYPVQWQLVGLKGEGMYPFGIQAVLPRDITIICKGQSSHHISPSSAGYSRSWEWTLCD